MQQDREHSDRVHRFFEGVDDYFQEDPAVQARTRRSARKKTTAAAEIAPRGGDQQDLRRGDECQLGLNC